MVVNPVTINIEANVGDAFKLMEKYKISGIPVVEGNKKVFLFLC